MAETVLQLTYISACDPHMAPGEVERILSAARLHNRRSGVTGLLLFNGQRFLQLLEGPADAVEATFARIERDPRHRGVTLLSRREAEFRTFSNWSMTFERIDNASPERRQSLIALVHAMVDGVDSRLGDHFLDHARTATGKAA